MEILNGFSFDIQRFATADMSGSTITVEGMDSTFNPATGKVYWHKASNKFDVTTGTNDLVISLSGTTGDYTTTSIPTDKITAIVTGAALTADEVLKLPASVAIVVTEGTADDLKLATVVENGCTFSGATAVTTTAAGKVSALAGTVTVASGTLALTDTATNTTLTLAKDAKISTETDGLVTAADDAVANTVSVTTGNITLTAGAFTATEAAKTIDVQGATVNGNTFTGAVANTYTYGANNTSAAFVANNGTVTTTSDISKVTSTELTGTGLALSGVVAKFESASGVSYVSNFTGGSIVATTAQTFTWDKEGDKGTTSTEDIVFTGFKGTLAGTGATSIPTVTGMTLGTIATGTATASISVNGTTFTNGAAAALTIATNGTDVGVQSGTLNAKSGSYGIFQGGALKESVIVATGTEVKIATNNDGIATVTELTTKGEKVTIGDTTYTVVNNTVVKGTKDGVDTYYNASGTGYRSGAKDGAGNALTLAVGSEIQTNLLTSNGTYTYNVLGIQEDGADAATVKVNGTSREVTVKDTITGGVNVSGDTIKVTDSGSTTDYTLSASSKVKAKNSSFNVADGVVSNAKGTLTLVGTTSTLTAKGAVNVDATAYNATAKDDVVTFLAGTSVNGATFKLADQPSLTITESSNKTDTKISVINTDAGAKYKAAVTGLDAGAVVTGAVDSSTYATAGNGAITINGKKWTVAGDDDGVTFTVDTTKPGMIGAITGLVADGSVSTDTKLAGDAVSVDGDTFTFTIAKSGATFSKDATAGATATLKAKGDTVATTTFTYTVDAVGSSGGIVVGDGATNGYLSDLSDGDKITVSDKTAAPGTKTITYEVAGKNLIVNSNTASGAGNKVYTLSDGETAFTIKTLKAVAGLPDQYTEVNGAEGLNITADFGSTSTNKTAVTSIADGVYFATDGKVVGTKDKTVGKVSVTNDLVKYESQTDKSQYVNVTGAGNTDWYVTTGAGKDEIEFVESTNVSINGGAGDDIIKANGSGDKLIYVSSGNNEISVAGSGSAKVSLGSGKDTLNAFSATGEVVVTAAGGNNFINFGTSTNDDVTITGSSGNDTIVAATASNVVKGNGGNNVYLIEGDFNGDTTADTTKVKISDYTFGKDMIGVSVSGSAPSVSKSNLTSDGKITFTNGAEADISETAGDYYAATLVDATGKKTSNIAWAKDGAAKLDTSSFSKDANLFGNEDGSNYLVSGAGKDTIHSYGDNDTVYGGAGDDSYVLSGSKTGRVVGFSTSGGKDAVSGFVSKFEEGDSIYMLDGSFANLKGSFSGTSATLKSGSAQLTFSNITPQSSGAAEFVISGKKAALLAASTTASVESASYADAYIGDNSAVDFSKVDGDVYVDLSNDLSSNGSGPKFVGIHTVTGGAGKSTLIGSAKDDLITAGTGESSLYGGKGKDTLVGNSDYADTFFIGSGSGTSTITGFQTADQDTADTLGVLSGNITAAKLVNSTIEISSDSSKAVITSLANGSIDANSKIKVAANNFNGVAKIGAASSSNNFTFEKGVGYYGGGSAEDKLAVDSSNTENAQVWLDGSQGVAYTSVDVIDFSSGSADYILAGDSAKNTITGGTGNNSLWGGAGNSVDYLESNNSGTTTFFYGKGEGNDIIAANSSNDVVNLYNISLADVSASTTITGSGVDVILNDGTKLTVNTGNNNVRFNLASGESYVANQSTKTWDA